jgi:hypothetical protein
MEALCAAAVALADLLPSDSAYYPIIMGVGFVLGIYAHAAKMPRLVAFSILLVLFATILTAIAARHLTDGPGAELP